MQEGHSAACDGSGERCRRFDLPRIYCRVSGGVIVLSLSSPPRRKTAASPPNPPHRPKLTIAPGTGPHDACISTVLVQYTPRVHSSQGAVLDRRTAMVCHGEFLHWRVCCGCVLWISLRVLDGEVEFRNYCATGSVRERTGVRAGG